MIPGVRWLNSTANKAFVVDYDTFTLYRVAEEANREFVVHQINSCSASLPTGKLEQQDTVRSFALDHSSDNFLAIGFTSGRISIFPADIDATTKFIRGEEIREVQRSITYLEWNYFDSNRLCAAYERGRGPDHTVVIYDLNRTLRNIRELPVSIFETNFTEKIFGVSWFRDDPNLLLISANRGLRIADIREHGNFQNTLSVQNPLMSISSEPNHGFLFACHSKNSILVYDRRFLTFSPLHEIETCPSNKIISKLSWHPKRDFHLSAIVRDSGNFYNFSISANAFRQNNQQVSEQTFHRQADSRNELPEYAYGTRLYSVPGISSFCSFHWHPLVAERIAFLVAPQHGSTRQSNLTKDVIISNFREDVSFDISCIDEFARTSGHSLKINDICLTQPQRTMIFKSRALNCYGYGNTLSSLSTIIENSRKAIGHDLNANEDLRFCWNWIYTMYQSMEANEMQKTYGTVFVGIKHILKGTKSNSTIKQDEVTFRNRIFVNDKRLKILRMCNWPNYNDRDDCKSKFDELASRGGVNGITRAAALSLFSVQGSLCKEYLIHLNDFVHSREFIETGQDKPFISAYQRMAEIVLNVMQKYDGVRVPDYERICDELINDNYLLSIVKFLARRDKIYNKIYNEIFESNIDLEDKLAFAALHMDDEFLNAALNKLIKELLQTRPLSALLIVGLEDHPETHEVLHRFLDITEDIQTASILFVIGDCFRKCQFMQDSSLIGAKPSLVLERAIESENRTNPRRRSLQCFREYIELLNRWKLWLLKAFLFTFIRPKVQFSDLDARSRVANIQAVIACTYCASPIYPSIAEKIENLRTPKISTYPRRTGANSRTRTMSCLCKKPLPKCIICRRHLGSQVEPEMNEREQKVNSSSVIDHWFVWCSSCNHGGHLAHIRQWFNEYPVCASHSCECSCLQRDHLLKNELHTNSIEHGGATEDGLNP